MSIETAAARETSLLARVRAFFYAEEVPYGLALLRMCLPVAILCDMVPRWFYARELYSSDGAPTPLSVSYGTPLLFPEFHPVVAVALHSCLLLALVTMMIGWRTRISVAFAAIVYTAFCLLDSVSTLNKYTVIATHVLVLLSLSECGAVWSIDSLLARRKQRARGMDHDAMLAARRSPVWPQRLIQFLIGFVYFGAAFTKIHTPAFFSGDQMYHWLMTDYNSDHPLGHWMSMFPWVLVASAYLTITWEILFVFLSWKGIGRIICLAMGAGFHLMTLGLLGLYIFPMVCIPIYFAFFGEQDYERLFARVQRWREKSPTFNWIASAFQLTSESVAIPQNAANLSNPLFFTLVAFVAFGGVGAEYLMDPYGERRPEGRHTLTELDPEFVEQTLLVPDQPMRSEDKFNMLSLGTFTIGGIIADARTEFHQGDRMLVQTILVPPHEDLWVDFSLCDDQGRVIDVVGNPVSHDWLRVDCMFSLPASLDPGDYAIVVKSAGQEVLRRKFTLLPGKNVPAAVAN